MRKIQEAMEKGVESLDKLHKSRTTPVSKVEFHTWLKSHQKALLEAVREEVRGEITEEPLYVGETQYRHYKGNIRWVANQSLQDIETIINKAIGV